MMTNKNQLIKI